MLVKFGSNFLVARGVVSAQEEHHFRQGKAGAQQAELNMRISKVRQQGGDRGYLFHLLLEGFCETLVANWSAQQGNAKSPDPEDAFVEEVEVSCHI